MSVRIWWSLSSCVKSSSAYFLFVPLRLLGFRFPRIAALPEDILMSTLGLWLRSSSSPLLLEKVADRSEVRWLIILLYWSLLMLALQLSIFRAALVALGSDSRFIEMTWMSTFGSCACLKRRELTTTMGIGFLLIFRLRHSSSRTWLCTIPRFLSLP